MIFAFWGSCHFIPSQNNSLSLFPSCLLLPFQKIYLTLVKMWCSLWYGGEAIGRLLGSRCSSCCCETFGRAHRHRQWTWGASQCCLQPPTAESKAGQGGKVYPILVYPVLLVHGPFPWLPSFLWLSHLTHPAFPPPQLFFLLFLLSPLPFSFLFVCSFTLLVPHSLRQWVFHYVGLKSCFRFLSLIVSVTRTS